MILVEDGKCTICGNRDNIVSLNDHDDNRTVTIICKDCLIDVLLNRVIYHEMKVIMYKDEKVTREQYEKLEKELGDIVFDAIKSSKG